MKFFVILVSILISISLLGFSESLAEDYQNTIQVEKNDLIITLSTDQFSYSQQEPIHVTYQIKNLGGVGINFLMGDSCDDGFFGYLTNQEDDFYFERFLEAGNYLIPLNNSLKGKIDDDFHGKVLLMIKNGEPQDYGLIVYGDKKRISEVLQERHDATSIHEASRLGFVTAKVPVNEILKIAKYSFVHSIGDGEKKLCAQAIMRGTLDSLDEFEKSFFLSQEFYRYPDVHTLPLGDYEVVLNFRLLDENLLPSDSGYGNSPSAGNIELLTLRLPITISDKPHNVEVPEKLIYEENPFQDSSEEELDDEPIPPLRRGFHEMILRTTDLNRNTLSSVQVGQQSQISMDLVNEKHVNQSFVWFVEIVPSKDRSIVFSDSVSGLLELGDEYSLNIPWTPTVAGQHEFTSNVWKSLDNQTQLYSPTSGSISVKDVQIPPKKQLQSGLELNEISCRVDLELIFKSSNNSPACVKPETAQKLLVRGWTVLGNP